MQQQELHSTIEQHRAAQWAGSINEIDEPFPHFKVAKDLSNNLVKWQVLLAANWQQSRQTLLTDAAACGSDGQTGDDWFATARDVRLHAVALHWGVGCWKRMERPTHARGGGHAG